MAESSSALPAALNDEIESINAIFGDNTLSLTSSPSFSSQSSQASAQTQAKTQSHILILTLPFHTTSLRLSFPRDYPVLAPSVLGPESSLPASHSSSVAKKGDAADFAAEARRVLEGCWKEGEPCVFDLVEELRESVEAAQAQAAGRDEESGKDDAASVFSSDGECGTSDLESDTDTPTTCSNPSSASTTATTSSHLSSLGTAGVAGKAAATGATVVFNALIRTHHVTSRKKVGKVKKAAQHELRYLLIRSGGSPGLMYAEGEERALREWVGEVAALRYKDYHLARPPAPLSVSRALQLSQTSTSSSTLKTSSTAHKHDNRNVTAKKLAATAEDTPGYEEVESVAHFAEAIERRGVLRWWRMAMGYEGGGDVIG